MDRATHEKTGPLVFGSLDMTPSKHVVMMWLAALLLIVASARVRKKSLVPRGLYNFLEMLVQFVRDEIAVKNIGKQDAALRPVPPTAFFFILFMNLLGLVPFVATATGNIVGHGGAGALHLRHHPVRGDPGGGARRLPGAPHRRRAAPGCGPS